MMIRDRRTEESKQGVGMAAPQRLVRAGVFCLLSSVLFPLYAENLPDPTRPPASIFAPAATTGIGRNAAAKSSSGLRSIIISETRRAAIINGKTVELGGYLGKARLVEVNAGSVVLLRGKRRQVLTLFPGVKITRMEMADTGSAKMESSDNETQVEQPSPSIKVESDKHELKPVARDERLLTGHPREEK
jgi:MSHA biogenesis protein MshK